MMNLNFETALHIANVATFNHKVDYWVRVKFFEGNYKLYKKVNYSTYVDEEGYQYNNLIDEDYYTSVEIVIAQKEWSDLVQMTGWELCARGAELSIVAGKVPVLIDGYERTWNGSAWISSSGNVAVKSCYHIYTVKYLLSDWKNVTKSVLGWWSDVVLEELK